MKRLFPMLALLVGLAVAGNLWSPGMAASWSMENTVLDGSGNGNDSTSSGISYVAGKLGQGILMPDDAIVYFGSSATLRPDAWTLCFWQKWVAGGPRIGFNGPSSSAYPIVRIYATTNSALLYMNNGNYQYFDASPVDFTDELWHHVAFTMPGAAQSDIDDCEMIVDGAHYQDKGTKVTSTAQAAKAGPFTLYEYQAGAGNVVDEVYLFDRVLTVPEIRRVMMGFTP